MGVFLINIVVYPLLLLWTLISIILAYPLFWGWNAVSGWDKARTARMFIWFYGRVWMEFLRPFGGVHKKHLSREQVPTPCVFTANHLSFFDVYCMGTLPVTNFSIVVRAWPFKMGFYAPFMRAAGYVNSEATTPEEFDAQCSAILQKGGSILFFPEGHRSKDGHLGRFYSGAFKVAVDNNVPVVPLVLSGSDKHLPRGQWLLQPAAITVQGLDAIYPEQFADAEVPHVAMRKYTKQAMSEVVENELRER